MEARQDFHAVMSVKTDEELYDVLSHQADYTHAAFEAAREEFARRNLDPSKIQQIETEAQARDKLQRDVATVPLQWWMRILMFLFPVGLLQPVVGEYYRNRGITESIKKSGPGSYWLPSLSTTYERTAFAQHDTRRRAGCWGGRGPRASLAVPASQLFW